MTRDLDDDVLSDDQGGEWDDEDEEPHLAYPGPHARGQVLILIAF